jgi:hypothetical protein
MAGMTVGPSLVGRPRKSRIGTCPPAPEARGPTPEARRPRPEARGPRPVCGSWPDRRYASPEENLRCYSGYLRDVSGQVTSATKTTAAFWAPGVLRARRPGGVGTGEGLVDARSGPRETRLYLRAPQPSPSTHHVIMRMVSYGAGRRILKPSCDERQEDRKEGRKEERQSSRAPFLQPQPPTRMLRLVGIKAAGVGAAGLRGSTERG